MTFLDVAQGLAFLIPLILTLFLGWRFDLTLKRLQVRENTDRLSHNLKVGITARLFPHRRASGGQQGVWILESRVRVKNNGHVVICLPAVYLQARSLDPVAFDDDSIRTLIGPQAPQLPSCDSLSVAINLARISNSMIQLSAGDSSEFVRWDVVDRSFIERFPVVALMAAVFGAAHPLLGFSHDGHFGKYRKAWLDYMNGSDRTDMTRHRNIVIGRAAQSSSRIEVGQRVLFRPGSQEMDVDASVRFREVLQSIDQSDCWHTVDLRALVAASRSPLEP